MTDREQKALQVIVSRPGCTAADIANVIGLERRTVNALLVLMELGGDIERTIDRGCKSGGDRWFPVEGAGLNG